MDEHGEIHGGGKTAQGAYTCLFVQLHRFLHLLLAVILVFLLQCLLLRLDGLHLVLQFARGAELLYGEWEKNQAHNESEHYDGQSKVIEEAIPQYPQPV